MGFADSSLPSLTEAARCGAFIGFAGETLQGRGDLAGQFADCTAIAMTRHEVKPGWRVKVESALMRDGTQWVGQEFSVVRVSRNPNGRYVAGLRGVN
jgi:hypothetical protein